MFSVAHCVPYVDCIQILTRLLIPYVVMDAGRFLLDGLFRVNPAVAERHQSPRRVKLELGFGQPGRHVGQKKVSSVI